jgi:hypothetical protein
MKLLALLQLFAAVMILAPFAVFAILINSLSMEETIAVSAFYLGLVSSLLTVFFLSHLLRK